MSVQNFTPSNDVELSIFTTEPGISTENISTGDDWETFKFIKRDFRLGNINAKYDDFFWLENQFQCTQNILSLRKGALKELAPICLMRVIAVIELSHSRNGFLRNWFRTFNFTQKEPEEKKPSIWGKVFKS